MTTPSESSSSDPPDDVALGQPIAELQDLTLGVSDRFGRRVRNGIERRVLAGDLLDLAWSAPIAALIELIRASFELFRGNRRT
jgi:hypothetical protein